MDHCGADVDQHPISSHHAYAASDLPTELCPQPLHHPILIAHLYQGQYMDHLNSLPHCSTIKVLCMSLPQSVWKKKVTNSLLFSQPCWSES